MYNTTEVRNLNITKADINFLKNGGFDSVAVEGRRHVKILPWLSIVQATEGSYDIAIGNGELEQTGEGGFFIAPAEVQQTIVHHVNEKSGKMSARWIFVDVEINKIYSLDSLYRFPTVMNGEMGERMKVLFDSFFKTEDIWERYTLCYKILGVLMSTALPLDKKKSRGIEASLVYIKENYPQQMTVGELAKIACMSESNFYSAFKKRFGSSPIAYLNKYRLSIAAERLSGTNDAIYSIASSVGVEDSLYFSKLFKRIYGMSPKEYRGIYSE